MINIFSPELEINLWEFNTHVLPDDDSGIPPLIHPEAIKSQACRATVDVPRLGADNDDDDDSDEDEVPEKMWVTIGLSRVSIFVAPLDLYTSTCLLCPLGCCNRLKAMDLRHHERWSIPAMSLKDWKILQVRERCGESTIYVI